MPRKAVPQDRVQPRIVAAIGVVGVLLPMGLQMIGITVNLWLGAVVLFIAFALLVYAFWRWERTSKWHAALRSLTVLAAFCLFLFLLDKQMAGEWKKEHAGGGVIVAGQSTAQPIKPTTPATAPVSSAQSPSQSAAKAKPNASERPQESRGANSTNTSQQSSGNNSPNTSLVQGPGSAAVMGGTGNSATVNNFAPPPWLMTTEQEDQVASAMAAFSKPGRDELVASVFGDAESIRLGEQFIRALKRAGWKIDGDQPSQAMWTPSFDGIAIVVAPSEGTPAAIPKVANALGGIIRKSGFVVSLQLFVDEAVKPGTFELRIGRRPIK